MRYTLPALILFLLISCSLKPIRHGVVNPQVTHGETKNHTLNIVIANSINDKILIEGGRASPLTVYDFRSTVKDALIKIFEKDFRSVEFSEDSTKHLTLIVQGINAVWSQAGRVFFDNTYTEDALGRPVSMPSIGVYKCIIKNSAVLKYKGEIVSQVAEKETHGEPNQHRGLVQQSFLNTLQKSFEDLHSSILTTQVHSKL